MIFNAIPALLSQATDEDIQTFVEEAEHFVNDYHSRLEELRRNEAVIP